MVAGRVSHSRQVVFPPWGYHAGCHGSPVIMNTRPGPQGGGKSDKRFGFDRKRMLLPSPAFGFANTSGAPSNQTKPQSRSQTSMSYYSNEYQQQQPWCVSTFQSLHLSGFSCRGFEALFIYYDPVSIQRLSSFLNYFLCIL